MKDCKVWARWGDNSDYESFDTPCDAGRTLGNILNPDGKFTKEMPELAYVPKGVETEGFVSMNYISLFWGDDDAQPVNEADLNESDRLDFEQGIREGLNS